MRKVKLFPRKTSNRLVWCLIGQTWSRRPLQLQGRLEASHSSSVYSGGKVFGNGQRLIQLSVSFSLSQFRLAFLVSVQLSLLLGRLPWSLTFLALIKCFIIILISHVFPSLELVCWTSLWGICEVKSFKKRNDTLCKLDKIYMYTIPPKASSPQSVFFLFYNQVHVPPQSQHSFLRGSPKYFFPLNELPGMCW